MKVVISVTIFVLLLVQLISAAPAPEPEPLLQPVTNTLGSVVNLTSGVLKPVLGSLPLGSLGGVLPA